MTKTSVVAWLGASIVAASIPLAAHHSGAMFEEKKTITVQGVVKEFQYTNPHSWLWVDVTGKDGKVKTWGFEAEGPTTLQRAGIRPSDFKVGTKLTITGNPMKDGTPAAIWVDAVRADGLSEERAQMVADGYERSALSAREKLAIELADAYLGFPAGIGPELARRLALEFSPAEIASMLVALVAFNFTSRTAVSLGGMPEGPLPVTVVSVASSSA